MTFEVQLWHRIIPEAFVSEQNGAREVGAVEAGAEHDAVAEAQLLHHVLLHARGGRGRQRHQWHVWEAGFEDAQPLVVRPEVLQTQGLGFMTLRFAVLRWY